MPSGLGSSSDQDQPTIPPQGEIVDAGDRDVAADPANATGQAGDATIAPTGSPAISPGMPQLQDYELLEELGRGGMGVVYKARQKKLDRIVALKMILGGQFASEEAVRRFELEAETAARLDHPGIVPIYEIGHSHGNHFFSMKLIEGCSLAERLDFYQSDPRRAVELMIEIAQAVQHAHERGVLHRDLKPANILIDNDGQAAVTDLGLAKHLDEDVSLTQTGLVMGSPGFMSPEQAAGKSDVTIAADVYSLGAILYWLITGRPPFQSDSRLEVIMQTIDSVPESIRVHRPDADRDLNLICQKTLQKSPAHRYASAMEFAEDLTAWLDGDALSVKPPSTIDSARIWIRKNFRTVALASTAGILCGLLIGTIILMFQLRYQIEFSTRNYSRLGETTAPWDAKYFSWINSIPRWILTILPPSMVWLNVAFGIWVIGLIKPESREIGLVAATAAALLSGIVAYTVSLGWAPIREYSIDRGSQDIELISDAMWMDEGGERELARRALTQRYPGLQTMDAAERGHIVFQKILTDQSLGVPKGMWVGIGTTLFLTVLPLFFAASLSGLIWDQGNRGWAYFGKSIELGIYSALFFLVMTKFVTDAVGPSPGLVYQVTALAGIGLGLYFGLSDKSVMWRIVGFVIVNICLYSNFSESARIDRVAQMAATATTPKQLATASHYFEKKLAQKDDPWTRFQLGILAAYRGDEVLYAEQCHALLMDFQHIYRPNVAERIVKVSLLKPECLSDSEKQTVYELADIVSGYESSFDREWLYFARAMSEMRQGNLAETLDWSARCREASFAKPTGTRVYLIASTYVVDALAYQQTGNNDKIVSSIAKGKDTIDTAGASASFSWQQRMVCEVLLEEATGSKNFE